MVTNLVLKGLIKDTKEKLECNANRLVDIEQQLKVAELEQGTMQMDVEIFQDMIKRMEKLQKKELKKEADTNKKQLEEMEVTNKKQLENMKENHKSLLEEKTNRLNSEIDNEKEKCK